MIYHDSPASIYSVWMLQSGLSVVTIPYLYIHIIVAVCVVPIVNSAFSDAGGDLQTGLAKSLLAQHKPLLN
jgi:hypothetical protein